MLSPYDDPFAEYFHNGANFYDVTKSEGGMAMNFLPEKGNFSHHE